MSNIYQEIWDADIAEASGVEAQRGQRGDPNIGFVTVTESRGAAADARILSEVHIPDAKMESYRLALRLFDNYALSKTAREMNAPYELQEEHDLLQHIVGRAPMRLAREYITQRTGQALDDAQWYSLVQTTWFRQFSVGGSPSRSGFEHVFVGEQSGSTVGGYHFWYRYFLDDTGGLTGSDDIEYAGTRYDGNNSWGELSEQGILVPEVVTLSYKWNAFDYDARAVRPLRKKIGGFFVGPSPEGLMALGMVRAHLGAAAPKAALINGARYELKLYRSDDGKSINTFYPVFQGAELIVIPDVTGPTHDVLPGLPFPVEQAQEVRIIAALVNPTGNDEGRELLTLINTGSANADLAGWRVSGPNDRPLALTDLVLQPGEARTLRLPKNTAQLGNQGGKIRLSNANGTPVHEVDYSRQEASAEQRTLLFA